MKTAAVAVDSPDQFILLSWMVWGEITKLLTGNSGYGSQRKDLGQTSWC